MRNASAFLFALTTITAVVPLPPAAAQDDAALIERGRYVARTAGCNDCHTPGYAAIQFPG